MELDELLAIMRRLAKTTKKSDAPPSGTDDHEVFMAVRWSWVWVINTSKNKPNLDYQRLLLPLTNVFGEDEQFRTDDQKDHFKNDVIAMFDQAITLAASPPLKQHYWSKLLRPSAQDAAERLSEMPSNSGGEKNDKATWTYNLIDLLIKTYERGPRTGFDYRQAIVDTSAELLTWLQRLDIADRERVNFKDENELVHAQVVARLRAVDTVSIQSLWLLARMAMFIKALHDQLPMTSETVSSPEYVVFGALRRHLPFGETGYQMLEDLGDTTRDSTLSDFDHQVSNVSSWLSLLHFWRDVLAGSYGPIFWRRHQTFREAILHIGLGVAEGRAPNSAVVQRASNALVEFGASFTKYQLYFFKDMYGEAACNKAASQIQMPNITYEVEVDFDRNPYNKEIFNLTAPILLPEIFDI